MIASLGMYDRPELTAAHDRYWALIRDGLRAHGLPAPETLTRGDGAYWVAWQSPDLILSQTCGYPYRARLHGRVTLIGTPDFGLPGCPPGHYNSVLVARADDPRARLADFDGAALAYNEGLSQSGWAAPMNHAAAQGLRLRTGPQTGAHVHSARAVAEGAADLAALDAVTWALIQRHDPARGAPLKEIGRTPPTPALPYIAALGAPAGVIAGAVRAALAALTPADRDLLMIRDLVDLPAAAYLAVPNPPPPDPPG